LLIKKALSEMGALFLCLSFCKSADLPTDKLVEHYGGKS